MPDRDTIRAAFSGEVDAETAREEVERTIAALDRGEVRVAEKVDGDWVVNEWVKEAILLYFRLREMDTFEVGPYEYHDKIPLKTGLADRSEERRGGKEC